MKKSSKHRLTGGAQAVCAVALTSTFLLSTGKVLYDNYPSNNDRITSEENKAAGIVRIQPPVKEEKTRNDVDDLIGVAKAGGVVLSLPLALLFGGLSARRFDMSDMAKYIENNGFSAPVEIDVEEDHYLQYRLAKREGSTRANMYPAHFAERYEREQAANGKPSGVEHG